MALGLSLALGAAGMASADVLNEADLAVYRQIGFAEDIRGRSPDHPQHERKSYHH